jgi:gas vesicle protein
MKTFKWILSLGIATGAGLAIGVLTAPRKGKHTRNRIKNEFEDMKDSFEDAANTKLKEAKTILNETLDNQKKRVASQLKNAKNKITDKSSTMVS